jgi:hypothetical protein
MDRPNEQITLETALGWIGVGMSGLLLILVPMIVLVPTMRVAAGVILFLVGLFAWVSNWAIRS